MTANVSIGDSKNNPIMVDEGTMHAAYTASFLSYQALKGQEAYNKPCNNIRFWFNQVGTRFNLAVRADSKIRNMTDLKDKHICLGMKGGDAAYLGLAFLEFHGLTPEKVKSSGGQLSYMPLGEAANMLQDGKIDAMFCMVAPYHILKSVDATFGVRLIPMSKESIQYVIKRYPGGE